MKIFTIAAILLTSVLLTSVDKVVAFTAGDFKAQNVLTVFYNVPELSEGSRGVNKYKIDYMLRVQKKGTPVWVKVFHSRDQSGQKKLMYFNRYSAGYSINRNFSIVIEKQEFNFKSDELYRIGAQVRF